MPPKDSISLNEERVRVPLWESNARYTNGLQNACASELVGDDTRDEVIRHELVVRLETLYVMWSSLVDSVT